MRETRNTASTLVKVSTMVAAMGAFGLAVLGADCGGTGGERTGLGGTTGAANTAGGAGTGGTGGTGGTVVMNSCPNGGVLDCTAPTVLSTNGDVTKWAPEEWSVPNGKWCSANGLRGSRFSYSDPNASVDGGVTSSNTNDVDTGAGNIKYTLTVAPGGWAGGGISFDSCVDASAFNAIQFTASLTSGSFDGCDWQIQLQTQDQRPSSQSSPPGGLCDMAANSCYQFPAVSNLTIPTATPTTITKKFTEFSMPTTSALPAPKQLVGLQFHVQSSPPTDSDGGTQVPCTVELRIDDVKFVTAP